MEKNNRVLIEVDFSNKRRTTRRTLSESDIQIRATARDYLETDSSLAVFAFCLEHHPSIDFNLRDMNLLLYFLHHYLGIYQIPIKLQEMVFNQLIELNTPMCTINEVRAYHTVNHVQQVIWRNRLEDVINRWRHDPIADPEDKNRIFWAIMMCFRLIRLKHEQLPWWKKSLLYLRGLIHG